MSQCVPQYIPLSSHLYLQMFIVMSHWSGLRLWLLWHHQYWILIKIPVSYPIITLCHKDSTLSTTQPFADDKDFWMGQFRVLDVGLGGSWASQDCWLSLICTTRTNTLTLLWLGHPMWTSAGGRDSSPILMPLETGHLRPHFQSQLHCAV